MTARELLVIFCPPCGIEVRVYLAGTHYLVELWDAEAGEGLPSVLTYLTLDAAQRSASAIARAVSS